MNLVLINSQSSQQIKLDAENPVIIGRGNVDGCSDKRVSRNHGKLTCTQDGKINLLALHTNPCFFTRNGVPPVVQLNKDEEETLAEGDCIGLLPNAFWFQITSDKNAAVQPQNNGLCKVKVEVTSDEEVSIVDPEIKASSSERNEANKESSSNQTSGGDTNDPGPSNSSSTLPSPELEKTRRLPLWMYEIDEADKKKTSPSKRSSPDYKEIKNKKKKSELKQVPVLNLEETDEVKVKEEVTSLDSPSTSKIPHNINVSDSEESSEESKNTALPTSEGESSKQKTKEGYEEDVNEGAAASSRTPRKICEYEANCYRKNPQHKLEFSHPGDDDYVPYAQRPICRYGSACYRRNIRHKTDFRHPPQRCGRSSSSSSSSSSSEDSRESVGEERPPCRYGSSCYNRSPRHRKNLYHPPKGYKCYFRRTDETDDILDELAADSDSSWSDPANYFDIDGFYGYGSLLDYDDYY